MRQALSCCNLRLIQLSKATAPFGCCCPADQAAVSVTMLGQALCQQAQLMTAKSRLTNPHQKTELVACCQHRASQSCQHLQLGSCEHLVDRHMPSALSQPKCCINPNKASMRARYAHNVIIVKLRRLSCKPSGSRPCPMSWLLCPPCPGPWLLQCCRCRPPTLPQA